MRRVTIGCGTGFDQYGRKIEATERDTVKSVIVKAACEQFGGVTITDTFGGWRDSSGKDVIESGWTITLYTGKDTTVFVRQVRDLLRQESVVVCIEEINMIFA